MWPSRHVEVGVVEPRAPRAATARSDRCLTGRVGGAHARRQCCVLAWNSAAWLINTRTRVVVYNGRLSQRSKPAVSCALSPQ
ncbi:hypothetical protein NDU88_007205 [Pleurodeles waltl]|uniref:Uncharacterized protein n=1 Tax=Pleurodeles waltl TaxID=8319 RepID=A0AAV7SS55_PLEWA|nr:hypothetical protein NDU88_007205 [Pleurodeles waltl]